MSDPSNPYAQARKPGHVCECCGSPTTAGVWNHWACYPCIDDWYERAPDLDRPPLLEKYPTAEARCAAWQRFTDNWVVKHKAELAAAEKARAS